MHMYIEDRKILKEGDEKYMYSGWNLFFYTCISKFAAKNSKWYDENILKNMEK